MFDCKNTSKLDYMWICDKSDGYFTMIKLNCNYIDKIAKTHIEVDYILSIQLLPYYGWLKFTIIFMDSWMCDMNGQDW